MLTAAAAVLAMIPLTRSELWGPMAMAIMGGLVVATVLTLFFVPALYAAWYGVRRPVDALEVTRPTELESRPSERSFDEPRAGAYQHG
jgi:uncharacterized membrane protein YedE/YeeE